MITSSQKLDEMYDHIRAVFLPRQNPVTGLFPASTDINDHGDYTDAWVRDNVYTIMAPWALSLAYKRRGEEVRSDQLEQITIKLMRGLLQSMMRQSPKVERFKVNQNQYDCLHAKYDTGTGLPVVADDAWGHLQIDATSIWLLMLAQMTAGGIRIIFTQGEVNFVQNLLYYISRAHRTPDFGIWERGNKINNGKTEVNASSVGMAKSAMQALDGLNLFGKNGPKTAVVHTMTDAVARCRTTLEALLPRESGSKECDSALLSIIGFPAFAVGDADLVKRTREEILVKLGGNYGCKRFLLDGHQSVLEDGSRMYYEHSELINFEHVESEWPLFYTYLYIDSLFSGDYPKADFFRKKLEDLMVDKDGQSLLPELYYVEKEHVEAEKKHPGSQPRVPNQNVPLIWAQSLYLVGRLLHEDLLDLDDVDPLNLRLRNRRQQEASVALVVLAQNQKVKRRLESFGVISETLEDIQPVQVIAASHLVEAYHQLGANEQLGLTGRPRRILQSLSTSHAYNINKQKLLCLSSLQNERSGFQKWDGDVVSQIVRDEIVHIRKHWFHAEPAVFTLLIDEVICDVPNISGLFGTLRDFQLRNEGDRISHATADIAFRSARINEMSMPDLCLTTFNEHSSSLHQEFHEYDFIDVDKPLLDQVLCADAEADKVAALKELCQKHLSLEHQFCLVDGKKVTFMRVLDDVYTKAKMAHQWLLVRLTYALRGKPSPDVAEAVSDIMVRRIGLVVGSDPDSESHIRSPLTIDELVEVVKGTSDDLLEQALTLEMITSIGSLIRTQPELFDGLRTIRMQHLMNMCQVKRELSCEEKIEVFQRLSTLSPACLYQDILAIFTLQHDAYVQELESGYTTSTANLTNVFSVAGDDKMLGTDWLQWRMARGSITRFDKDFLKSIWDSLSHANWIAFGNEHAAETVLDCKRALSSMTPGEETFAVLIEEMLHHMHPAYYKSIVVEALVAFTEYCAEHPESYFEQMLNLGVLVDEAADLYVKEARDITIEVGGDERALDYLLNESPQKVQTAFKRTLDGYAGSR